MLSLDEHFWKQFRKFCWFAEKTADPFCQYVISDISILVSLHCPHV